MMPLLGLQNLFKASRGLYMFFINRGFSFYMAGVIPGGGLGKLQGIKEEEYFSRLDHKLFENLKEKSEILQCNEFGCFDYEHITVEDPVLRPHDCICSVKHKNCPEEAYFLSDHCDCMQLLNAQSKNRNE